MTSENTSQRLEELEILEERYKKERNFKGLISVHDEIMSLCDTLGILVERIPQKAYCYARLGLKNEAESTLKELNNYSFFVDQDEIYRAIVLIGFFIAKGESDIGLMERNTIKSWLQNPISSKQVMNIVFDYEDLVDDVTHFDYARLTSRHTSFSNELIDFVFSAMQRNDDDNIYYNKEKNEIQHEVEGYLTNPMSKDQTTEHNRLAKRIMNSDIPDPIIDGIHYLIPRLPLTIFLEYFSDRSNGFEELLDFVAAFESKIMKEYDGYLDPDEDLFFDRYIAKKLYSELDAWCQKCNFEKAKLNQLINATKRVLVMEFLEDVNE